MELGHEFMNMFSDQTCVYSESTRKFKTKLIKKIGWLTNPEFMNEICC